MDYEKIEDLENWIEKYGDCNYKPEIKFEDLKEGEGKFHDCKEISAIMFLASKLKAENKIQHSFLHGEHDEVLIGQSFDLFQDFTENDAKICVAHGILFDDNNEGFRIFASM